MKWMLVWWIIHPHHSQVMHFEHGFATEAECMQYAAEIPGDRDVRLRWHCSEEWP